ncbi:neuferricin-like, partial [Plectropomus leopardus]|uniref:neuferricin-like n=1 Tax=Plectropomus leopardus TaxID=160734 RepID=UPI001C4D77C5
MLGYVLAACVALAAFVIPRDWSETLGLGSDPEQPSAAARLLSSRELSEYDGAEGSPGLYLAILGQVFDVHEGRKHYGPGGAYHGMA